MKKKYCNGCRDNFYNGNNQFGIGECWNFKSAKVVWRIAIGHWEKPPYTNKKKKRVASCWHGSGSNRIHYIDPDKSLTPSGYWK